MIEINQLRFPAAHPTPASLNFIVRTLRATAHYSGTIVLFAGRRSVFWAISRNGHWPAMGSGVKCLYGIFPDLVCAA
jgi:hypothetical protein